MDIFKFSAETLNLCRSAPTPLWAGIFEHFCIGEFEMPKAARISQSILVSTASPQQLDDHPLVPIALFSGIGLLASLIAILMDVPGAWY
ncbi:hypothetical protein [Bradyrhizobium sp. dw_411]|uniref:hypothetical protein n=1 Tax=Bradyrhizobium sp. dw_411 TaxID=2720082 RepID=UPI001BCFEED4|nr:hypothetical protein [Bradyrhizobium sp. dw_411]